MEVLALAALAGVTAVGSWIAKRRRARERNARGACAMCGQAWSGAALSEAFLIHGQLVCQTCAARGKRHMLWQFGALGGAAALASGLIAASSGLVAMVLFPIGTTVVMTAGAIQLMKLANREAQLRIASGDFPEYAAVEAGSSAPALEGAGRLPTPSEGTDSAT